MARKGRDLEKLVALIEQGLGNQDIQITSPDWILDISTGKKREVDVSIRGKLGSFNFLIIIECRKRKGLSDVTWIEQIATKRDDLGANIAIAVSSSKFTAGAKEKAKRKNVELRTLSEIDLSEIRRWFGFKTIGKITRNFNIKGLYFPSGGLNERQMEKFNSVIKLYSGKIPKDLIVVYHPGIEHPLSADELFQHANPDSLFESIQEQDGKVTKSLRLVPEVPLEKYHVCIDGELIAFDFIDMTVELWIEMEEYEIDSVKEYRTEEKALAQIVKSKDMPTPIGDISVELHRIEKGSEALFSVHIEKTKERKAK